MKERTRRIGNRVGGLGFIVMGGTFLSHAENNPVLAVGGTLMTAIGIGDIISGEHIYLVAKAGNYLVDKIKSYRKRDYEHNE